MYAWRARHVRRIKLPPGPWASWDDLRDALVAQGRICWGPRGWDYHTGWWEHSGGRLEKLWVRQEAERAA
jgi:hypothetical protein